MSPELASKKLFSKLSAVYIINVFGKTAFTAATVALISENILTKTEAGIINAVFWLIYALGQVVGGGIANKFSPYILMNITLVGSAVTNVIMAFCSDFTPMLIIWSINGLFQFGLWPALLRIVSGEVVSPQRKRALTVLAYDYGIGALISTLLTAIILFFLPWKYMFISCGIVNLLSAFVVIYAKRKYTPTLVNMGGEEETADKSKRRLTPKFIWQSGLLFVIMLMFIKNFVDGSIKNWMPTILMESYGGTPEFTSLLTSIMLGLNIFATAFGFFLYKKLRNNEILTVRVLFIVALPIMLALLNLRLIGLYSATVLMTLASLLFYASGQFTLIFYPAKFQSFGMTAAMGGIINCFAALGNTAASYGGGFIADNFGWDSLMLLLFLLVAVYVAITFIVGATWKRFFKNNT